MLAWLFRLSDSARQRAQSATLTLQQANGRRAEDLAHRFLRRRGYTILARNYRPRAGHGEIDLVARHGDMLVFVEVKARSTTGFGPPEDAVDREKRERLCRAAREYCRRAGADWERVRFDIVAVLLSKPPVIELFADAFSPVIPR